MTKCQNVHIKHYNSNHMFTVGYLKSGMSNTGELLKSQRLKLTQ